MRTISVSLAAVLSLSAALAGGGAIAGERASHLRHLVSETESAQSVPGPTNRLYYGGTLTPIVVEGVIPAKGAPPLPAPTHRLWYGGTLAPIVVEGRISTKLSTRVAGT